LAALAPLVCRQTSRSAVEGQLNGNCRLSPVYVERQLPAFAGRACMQRG
jgi:hypothetical protein